MPGTPGDDSTLVLRADRILDGTGGPPIVGGVVTIVDGKIAAVGPMAETWVPPWATVLDLPGCSIVPGLVDSHVHLTMSAGAVPFNQLQSETDGQHVARAIRNARQALLAGVTTVRDLGSRGRVMLDVRDSIAAGVVPGPRILASGRPVTVPEGHLHFFGGVAEGADGVKALVSELIEEGVDAIKVIATGGNMTVGSDPLKPAFADAEIQAAVDTAHAAGKRLTAHARGVPGIAQVAEAGIDSIEHCRFEVGTGVWGFDEKVAEVIAKKGITASPTLAASHRSQQYAKEGGTVGLRPGALDTATKQKNALRLRECGVLVVVGTDAGASLAQFDEAANIEMELFVGAGWPPLEALMAGTLGAAKAIGLDREIGSVEPGKQADLLIVGGDPSTSITDLRRVRRVYQSGKLVVSEGQTTQDARRIRMIAP